MPTPEELKLAAALAGQVNRDLSGSVKVNPINPHEFLSKAGFQPTKPAIPANQIRLPGIIEQPKSTPTGSEVIGTIEAMPEFIPIPEDMKKFVEAETLSVPTKTSNNVFAPIVTNPINTNYSASHTLEDIWNSLEEIKSLLRSKYKSKSKSKSKAKKKPKLLNEVNPAMVTGPTNQETTTPGTSAQDS